MKARSVARTVAVILMGIAVIVATGDGFAQSYAGLYGWALEHGLKGWKAQSFPLLVDTFVGVGELGMFLLAIDGHRVRRSVMSWLDLLVPGLVAAAGWGASLVFNIGHVRVRDFATQATAAVPPLASMIGLLVLLRTLHRYVMQAEVPAPLALAAAPEDLELFEDIDDTPVALLAWLKGDDEEPGVPGVPEEQVRAAEEFGDEVKAGRVPSIRTIKKRLKVGQDKAREARTYLAVLVDNQRVPVGADRS